LHNAKTLTRLPPQGQFFSRGRFAGSTRNVR
jgi:hypothetical protein